ncbi:protoheme IX farnesyltransferase [Formosa sp. Hel3_A1_48]|jgi:protoheme IX farnesyltransferase|uniref:heme o synthase n=1 Tax=Formosa sp. Hel3_A1_48 TaxID=1336795 RepID=UPI00084E0E85|nr:heme o synthase [Formosa sp. Hel3_A1_48]MDA9846457.1 heme o synthase [Flavobacteriaceae bacterium]NCF41815.1 protoheme IX farnesyltransferase [Bacteroidota bacterium]AOR26253.1 protoheme IX farnesyltransferase [Formosa sp. Hel3_A1_48]MDC0949999.1 heme o synthase [Flavobacteriaceae bacterium]MDG1056110.1 heme o synthase [Flavobacteriaceae bacterium]
MTQQAVSSLNVATRFQDFKAVTKMGLSLSVVFSSIAGYLLAAEEVRFSVLGLLAVGGYCMVGASNVFNQIIERDLDALMIRTENRPIPSGRISVTNAFILGLVLTILGLSVLYVINPRTAMFAAVSIFLYTSVYTPLKQKTPLSVFAGAIPGAIPFMLGWVAFTGKFDIEPGTLFLIQFFWQFPHFWAIAWFLDSDYKKAGFLMLPTGAKDKGTVLQVIIYIAWTVLISLVPAFGVTGNLQLSLLGAVLIAVIGLGFLYYGFKLFQQQTDQSARKLMFVSILYITSLQFIYVLDKFI